MYKNQTKLISVLLLWFVWFCKSLWPRSSIAVGIITYLIEKKCEKFFFLSHVTACTSKSVKTSNVARGKLHTSNLWMIKKQWMFFSGCPLLSSYYILHCMYTPSTKTRYQQDWNSFVLEKFILIHEDLDFFSVEKNRPGKK